MSVALTAIGTPSSASAYGRSGVDRERLDQPVAVWMAPPTETAAQRAEASTDWPSHRRIAESAPLGNGHTVGTTAWARVHPAESLVAVVMTGVS